MDGLVDIVNRSGKLEWKRLMKLSSMGGISGILIRRGFRTFQSDLAIDEMLADFQEVTSGCESLQTRKLTGER